MWRMTNCAGVMIGRGAFGQPWIFKQARALIDGAPMPATPPVEERFAIALDHARMVVAYEADLVGAAIEFRKHLGWYAKGLPNSADLRRRLHAVKSFAEVEGIFGDYLAQLHAGAFGDPAAVAPDAARDAAGELETAEA
jgi:tRNA-dihydrouridine synthase